MAMTLKEQKQAFPVGSEVVAIDGCASFYPAGARGVVKKHYTKGSVYVRFSRSSGAKVSKGGDMDWFVDVENLAHPTPSPEGPERT